MNLCPPPHLLKIWEWLRTLYGKPWLSYVVIYHYVVWLLHYVLWFLHYVSWLLQYVLWLLHYLVCSQMWCGFVFMFCWLHFRYKALAPRLYSLLATSQTGFKRGLSSCSFPFLLIGVWRENITKQGPQTRVSYFEICCRKNWAWKCIRVVRWRACTSWCDYDRGSSSPPCPLC